MATTAYERSEPRDNRVGRTALAFMFAVCGGLAVVFLFFALMGAIDVGQAVALTAVCAVFAAVWVAGFAYRQLTQATRMQWRDRERRGF